MWRTAGARFNASRRLKHCNQLSALAIAVLSSYLLAISVIQMQYADYLNDHDGLNRLLGVVSVIGSVLIIVASLTEWAKDFSSRANRVFDNATNIKSLRTRQELVGAGGYPQDVLFEKLDAIRMDYEQLTGQGSPNHEPIDDLLFRARNYRDPHPSFKMSWLQSMAIRLWCHLIAYWFYFASIIGPPVLVASMYAA